MTIISKKYSITNNSADYHGILFDLDGTLLDTANDLGAALNYVLNKYQLPEVPKARFRPVASDGAQGLLTLGFGEQLAQFNYDQLREEFLSYYQNNLAVNTCLYSGVEGLLTELNQHDIPWGVVTNKPIDLTLQLLPNYPIFTTSKTTIGGDSLAQRKPHPAPLLHACKQLKIEPSQCLYVGDALRDIEAGNSANMFSIIAKWGYIFNDTKLAAWNADFIANTPNEIRPFIFS